MSCVVLESIEEIIAKAELNKLRNNDEVIMNGYAVTIKYVNRNGIKDDVLTIDSAVINAVDLPELREDLRIDVFKFYDSMLTNFYNRHLLSGLCDVITDGTGRVDQGRIKLGKYSEDRTAFINGYVNKDDRFNSLLKFITIPFRDKIDACVYADIKKRIDVEDDILPLVFVQKVDFIKLDSVKLPKSTRLINGDTLLLLDPSVTLPGIRIRSNTSIDNEIVVVTSNDKYLLGNSFKGRVTIRKLHGDELFTNKIYPYTIR